MKKYIYYLILFLFFLIPSSCLAIVEPTNEFYINDYAGILSQETEDYILQRSLALNEVDGTQIVVVTVKNLEGMPLEVYANKLFNSFGIGDEDKNNGLLLLLALEEREFRVEVGDGLSGVLPDGKTGRFQDEYIIPYLKENKWDEGIRNGYDAFYSEIVEVNNLNVDYTKPVEYYSDNNSGGEISSFGFALTVFIAIITGFMVNASGDKKVKTFFSYLGIWFILLVCAWYFWTSIIFYFFIYLFVFIFISFAGLSSGSNHGSSRVRFYSGSSYSSSSSSRSSSRSFSGGGGRSSGGGSSRRF